MTMDAETTSSGRLGETFLADGDALAARDALTRESGVDRRVIGFEDEERRERARRGRWVTGEGVRWRADAGGSALVETLPTRRGRRRVVNARESFDEVGDGSWCRGCHGSSRVGRRETVRDAAGGESGRVGRRACSDTT